MRYLLPFVLVACLGLVFLNSQYATNFLPVSPEESELRLANQPKLDPAEIDKDQTRMVVLKGKYQLQLYESDRLLKTYEMVMGFNPVDDKMMQGDGCTPEGQFKVKSMYDHKSWSKFIWFDYPNATSRKKFAQRKAEGKIPQEAKIGGDIGIHGVPVGRDDIIDNKQNWTLGCISLRTADILELYPLVKVGTVLQIEH